MKKILPALVFIFLAAACNKKEQTFETYHNGYTVEYDQTADTYVAIANFFNYKINSAVSLGDGESVTFNGIPPMEQKNGIYYWHGNGKPEMNFILTQGSNKVVNAIPLSEVGDFQIICPDTVSRSVKLAFRIKGLDELHPVSLKIINLEHTFEEAIGVKGDSCFINSYSLEHFITDGPYEISLNRLASKTISQMEQAGGAGLQYFLSLKKPVVFIP